jgi:drug/metabolite transporter (DMT)-like permease
MSAFQPVVKSSRLQLVTAFAAVYLIWGSTYLAIRFAVETLPPFFMMATRFLAGGLLFFLYALSKGEAKATASQWRHAATIGILMLCGATGVVGWAEVRVPSGLTALIIACVPFWIVLIDWLRPGGSKPTASMIGGLIVGFVGIVILVGPEHFAGGHRVDPIGAIALILACLSWSIGTIYSRTHHDKLPKSQWMTAGMELFVAGLVLYGVGFVTGEASRLTAGDLTVKSILSLVYLITFGSLGYAAYQFLLKASTPAKASTYAFVNPLVAVILGATLGGEEFNLRMGLAAIVIIGAVVVITAAKSAKFREESVPAVSKSADDSATPATEPS